jgi:hypothetical protein
VSILLEALATQLERPRDVTIKVADYLGGNYEVDRDGIGLFFSTRLPGED